MEPGLTTTNAAQSQTHAGSLPILGLLGAILSVQVGAAFAKSLFPALGPEGTTMLRLAIGALMLAAVLRPWKVLPTRKGLPWLAAYGVTVCAMNMLFYAALARIPLGICVALEFTGPLFVAMLGSRRALDLVWVVFAVAGIVLLSPFADVSRGLDPVGVLLALAAGGCWGSTSSWRRRPAPSSAPAPLPMAWRSRRCWRCLSAFRPPRRISPIRISWPARSSSACSPARCPSGWR